MASVGTATNIVHEPVWVVFGGTTLGYCNNGDVTVDMVGVGTNITLAGMPQGIKNLAVTRVYATGTTAAGIVALRA